MRTVKESREVLAVLYGAAVAAAMPDAALSRVMRRQGAALWIAGEVLQTPGAVHVIAIGKGAAPMARQAERILGDALAGGLAIVKKGHGLALDKIRLLEAAHPVPDERSARAGRALLQYLERVAPGDLVLALITGGASALTACPSEGLSLADLQGTTRALLQSGADIREMNAVRKHLVRVGGGLLARAVHPAAVRAILVSDVIGDDIGVIASGPFAPDSSTFAESLAVIGRRGISGRIPAAVLSRLQAGARGEVPETPKAANSCFARVRHVIAADNATALATMAKKAESMGFRVVCDRAPMQGEARVAALTLLDRARKAFEEKSGRPLCYLAGGETTVTVKGRGRGGRCQEMALAAAIALRGRRNVSALFAGTDGTDGPTGAAGGFADRESIAGLDALGAGVAERYLEDNDSGSALQRAGALFVTGPTRTNVMDVAAVVIEPQTAD